RLIAAEQHDENHDRRDRQRNIGDRGQPLAPEMIGARMGGAQAADAGKRRADVLGGGIAHSGPPIASKPKIHNRTVIAIEPIRVAAASHSRSVGPKPRPVSQIKWRMPPSMWWITDQV